jgi:hypothetical protein
MNIQRLFTVLFAISLFAMSVRETLDADMWWHLRTGEYIIEHGIPNQDVFSFTVPDNEWITHEWLSEIGMWLVYDFSGFTGLILFFSAVITLAFFLVFSRCEGKPYLAAFVVLIAALASAPFWGARPQVFNMLFAAIFVFLVEGFKDGVVKKSLLWLLPLLTVLWANLHSGYLLGIALLVAYVVGESLQRLFATKDQRGLDWDGIRWLLLMAGASFAAAVLNPNGPELWIYPFFTLGSGAMQQYILEWQSPDFHAVIFWPFAAMLGLGMLSFILSKRRPAWTDLLLFFGLAFAGLLSARHIPLFSIAAAPIVARYLLSSLEGTRLYSLMSGVKTAELSTTMRILNWILVLIALAAAGIWAYGKIDSNEAAVAEAFPTAAVDYIENSDLKSMHGYNNYNWGGYLIWREIPVFVDGRADVYGDDFLHRYRRTYDVGSDWQQPLDEFEVDYVLMDSSHPLSTLLAESRAWTEVYNDQLASIFLRSADS